MVILIDMQAGYVGKLRSGAFERILPNQIAVLEYAVKMSIPVAILEYSNEGSTIPELENILTNHSNHRYFTKYRDSGFSSDEFKLWLAELGVEILFFMGINAEYCVKETAKNAIALGYKIAISPGVIAGMSHHDVKDGIDWFESNGLVLFA